MQRWQKKLDIVISTIPRSHDVSPYLSLLKRDGSYVIVGAIESMTHPYDSGDLISRRARIAGSSIGGIRETQELLDLCAEKQIVSSVEVITIGQINDVHDRLARGDASCRYVIDVSSLS